MTTTATINSDDINSVSFPGSEAGISLVELVGTVNVSGSISSITLRLTASAVTPAVASPSAVGTTKRVLLSASTPCAASVSAVARSKIRFVPDAQTAVAQASSGSICRRRASAIGQGSVSQSAYASILVFRAATVDAKAVSSVTSFQESYFGATALARAVAASPYLLRKLPTTAQTSGAVAWSMPAKQKLRPSVASVARAIGSANEITVSFVSASAAASANCASIFSISRALSYPSPLVARAVPTASPKLVAVVSAASAASANSDAADVFLKMRLSASATATVAYAIAEADYSATMPAAIERVMVVPTINRRIEVTE